MNMLSFNGIPPLSAFCVSSMGKRTMNAAQTAAQEEEVAATPTQKLAQAHTVVRVLQKKRLTSVYTRACLSCFSVFDVRTVCARAGSFTRQSLRKLTAAKKPQAFERSVGGGK